MSSTRTKMIAALSLSALLLSGCATKTALDEIPNEITTIEDALNILNDNATREPTPAPEETQPAATVDQIPTAESPAPAESQSGRPPAPENTPTESPAPQSPTRLVPSNPTIADYIFYADFTEEAEQIFLNTDPRAVSKSELQSSCSGANITETSNVLGCFTSPPSRIYIYDIPDDRLLDAEAVIAAHEMLHAVWYLDLTASERTQLTQELKAYYDSLPSEHFLRDRLALYAESPNSIPTELHSILGTEAETLPRSLESHYARYFKNRQKVVSLANNSFRYMDSLQAQIKEFASALSIEKQTIDARRTELQTQNNTLNQDIKDFNNRVNSGYYDGNESAYDAERAQLESRQQTLNNDFEIFTQQTNTYNQRVKDYNALVSLNNELNNAIKTS